MIDKKFGKHLLNQFYFDPKYINVNNGSFGSPPRDVISILRKYQEEMDFNPEKFIRFTLEDKIKEIRKIVADYIVADFDGLVIVENASDGINAVFRSMLKSGDKLMIFDISYVSAKNCAKFLSDNCNVEIVYVILDEETLNDDILILNKLEDTIKKNPGIKLANVDHISSVPALKLPVEKIISLFRKYNIPVFIDGAHTVGQIKLNLKNMDPDFYISNFHKWGFNPKSACFLYVSDRFRKYIHPNIISSYYGKSFCEEFSFNGTKDYSPYLTIKDSLAFRAFYGEEDIMNYTFNLSQEAGKVIASLWKTELLIRDKNKFCSMVNVRIPCEDEETILMAVKRALFNHQTYIVTFKFNNGKYYARFSAQIYNEISDYIYAANVFYNLLKSNLKTKF